MSVSLRFSGRRVFVSNHTHFAAIDPNNRLGRAAPQASRLPYSADFRGVYPLLGKDPPTWRSRGR